MGSKARVRSVVAAMCAVAAVAGTSGGGAATAAAGPERVGVNVTQEYPLAGEEFTFSLDPVDMEQVRYAAQGGELTYSWTHEGDCTFSTPTDAETVTASCPAPKNRNDTYRLFPVEITSDGQVVGAGSGVVHLSSAGISVSAGALGKTSWFAGDLGWRGEGYVGVPVEIQMRSFGSTDWTTVTTVQTDEQGGFKTYYPVRKPGVVRAHFAGDGTVPEVWSKERKLLVQPKLNLRFHGSTVLMTVKDPWGKPLARQKAFITNGNGTLMGTQGWTDEHGQARLTLRYRGPALLMANTWDTRNNRYYPTLVRFRMS